MGTYLEFINTTQACHLQITDDHEHGGGWSTHSSIPRPLVKSHMEVTCSGSDWDEGGPG